jgi:hypothetical protein
MAGGKEDVEFTFDPESFLKGFKKITDAMNNFEVNTKEKGKKIEKTHESISAGLIAKGVVLANMFMGLAGQVVGFVKSGVPEIGKTFSVAGDIFKRNLFWPLRKELRPILQGILDWTRDHRAMFVRWGGMIVNVFRAIVQVVKGFFEMTKALIKPVADTLKSAFGGTAKSISDIFNIVLFKITAVIMFLQVAFMPIIKTIGKSIATLVKYGLSFFDGLSAGIDGIAGPFGDLINQFNELLKLLQSGEDEVNLLNAGFKTLGDFVGSTLYSAVSGLAQFIDGLVNSVKNVADSIAWAKAKITGNAAEAETIQKRMDDRNKEFAERSSQRADAVNKKWEGFGSRTKANFSPSSATSSKQINANSKVNIEKMEIKVAEGQDTKKAGADFIDGMNKKTSQNFKRIFLDEQGAMGF